VIVFLETYKNSHSSEETISSLEDYFFHAVYDFLDGKKESGEYNSLNIKYNGLIEMVEEIVKEKDLESDNTHNKVSKLIKKIINENNLDFMMGLFPYMIRYDYLAKLYRRS